MCVFKNMYKWWYIFVDIWTPRSHHILILNVVEEWFRTMCFAKLVKPSWHFSSHITNFGYCLLIVQGSNFWKVMTLFIWKKIITQWDGCKYLMKLMQVPRFVMRRMKYVTFGRNVIVKNPRKLSSQTWCLRIMYFK